MRVEAFDPEHFRALVLQPHQEAYQSMLLKEDWKHLGTTAGEAWTGFEGERVVACAGLLNLGGGRAEAWALVAHDAGRAMLPITRALRRGLQIAPYRFVQMHTAVDFPPAAAWARMLGFCPHSPALPAYCDDGADAILWTRRG